MNTEEKINYWNEEYDGELEIHEYLGWSLDEYKEYQKSGKTPLTELQLIKSIISEYRISQPIIAQKIGINENTFKLKLSGKYNQRFTHAEMNNLRSVLAEILEKIKTVISYNQKYAS